jgi:phospholipase/carboxylesterase
MTQLEPQVTTFEDWTLRVRPGTGSEARITLLLHGWTGDENSMWAFARDLPASAWLIAPRAPHLAASGYSWRVMKSGWPGYDDLRPSAALLLDLVDRWSIANAVESRQVDLLGFSQGAAMCVTFALAYPARARRIGILAGFAPPGAEKLAPDRPLEGKQVLVAHGSQDQIVRPEYAQLTVEFLKACGAEVTYCESDTGHKLGAECRHVLATFFATEAHSSAANLTRV